MHDTCQVENKLAREQMTARLKVMKMYLSVDKGPQDGVPHIVLLANTLVKDGQEPMGGVNIATTVPAL